ncbi:MAG: glycosyl hydrolase, partial [Bacteroidota bacterium]
MKKHQFILWLLLFISLSASSQTPKAVSGFNLNSTPFYNDSRPWTRWWGFATMIDKASITDNLVWLKNNGFGGVEIAWVYPLNRMKKDTVHYTPRQEWLSPAWSKMVAYAKHCADSLNLGCDFTFGSLWPFGDTKVPFNEATMNMTDPKWRQEIAASWDYPKKGYVIDHLNREAFSHYAERTGNALKSALKGNPSGLFCDSWEVETRFLSTPGFDDAFTRKFHYSLSLYKDSLYSNFEPYRSVRYDYMKLISEFVIDQFYRPFTAKCHELGAYSRVQCAGAPCDILSAYSTADIPESEALLYEPEYSNIVASAASLTAKKVVSSETFTCLYGWPRDHHSEEQTADLKLLADAVFANGVNQIIWHGKPYNPVGIDTVKFYASVHIGKTGALAEEIPSFNKYLETVSSYMKKGVNYSDVAVYLPTEETWIAGDLPLEKQFIWAWGYYEQRYTYLPEELKGWRPLWINGEFLKKAVLKDKKLVAGDLSFSSLYIDVKYMEIASLKRIVELAQHGLPVCLKQEPSEPGLIKSKDEYQLLIYQLRRFKNVGSSWNTIKKGQPLVSAALNFDFWCRRTEDGLFLFFANPKSQHLTFPLQYGQSLNVTPESFDISIYFNGKSTPVSLNFQPYQSLLLQVGIDGKISFLTSTLGHPKNFPRKSHQ